MVKTLVQERVGTSLDNGRLCPVEGQRDADDDHGTQDRLLEVLVDADDVHPVVEHAHEDRSEQGVDYPSRAAGERRSAYNDCRD